MYRIECLEVPKTLSHYPTQETEYGTYVILIEVTSSRDLIAGDTKTLMKEANGPFVYNDDNYRPLLIEYDENLQRRIVSRPYKPEHFWAEQRKRYAEARLTELITQV